jgi:hypothetical protein
MLQSCSSEDGSNNDSSTILCKKQVNGTFVLDYIYNGNKMDRIMANGQLNTKYYYTGNLITKNEGYIDNQLRWITTYTYENGKLASRLFVDLNPDPDPSITSGLKTIYTYISNDTISYENYSGTATEQDTLISMGEITLLNGQVVQNEGPDGITIATYDNKNSPFKNVTGFDKLNPSNNVVIQGNNNVSTIQYPNNQIVTYYYQYNEQGYPISSYIIGSSGSSSNTTQYFY